MSFDSLLIHTCDIGALSQVGADDYGTPAETWPLAYTAKECRIMSTHGREVKVGAKVMISNWKMFLPLDVTVDEQGRIDNWPKGFLDESLKESQRLMKIIYNLDIHNDGTEEDES